MHQLSVELSEPPDSEYAPDIDVTDLRLITLEEEMEGVIGSAAEVAEQPPSGPAPPLLCDVAHDSGGSDQPMLLLEDAAPATGAADQANLAARPFRGRTTRGQHWLPDPSQQSVSLLDVSAVPREVSAEVSAPAHDTCAADTAMPDVTALPEPAADTADPADLSIATAEAHTTSEAGQESPREEIIESSVEIKLEYPPVEACPAIPLQGRDAVGHRIWVLWPIDEAYYSGVVQKYSRTSNKHRIVYDEDGQVEHLTLSNEKVLWTGPDSLLSVPAKDAEAAAAESSKAAAAKAAKSAAKTAAKSAAAKAAKSARYASLKAAKLAAAQAAAEAAAEAEAGAAKTAAMAAESLSTALQSNPEGRTLVVAQRSRKSSKPPTASQLRQNARKRKQQEDGATALEPFVPPELR